MKKAILFFSLTLIVKMAESQTTIPSGILSFGLPAGASPVIQGNVHNDWRSFIISSGDGSPANGAYIHFFPTQTANYNDPNNGHIDLVSVGTPGAGDGIVFTNYDAINQQYNRFFVARKDGKVLIGSNLMANNLYPGNYKLYFQDGILTEKVKVALSSTADWSDYVFHKNYTLLNLDTLDYYVKKYSHLPGILYLSHSLKCRQF